MAAKQSRVETKTGLKKIMKPVISTDLMGNRNVEVKAVGARAEPAVIFSQYRPSDAVLAAQEQEEKIAAMQQEKEERLRRFQKDVRTRVQKITRTQRKQQLEKEYEKMQHQHYLLQKHLQATEGFQKNRVLLQTSPSVSIKEASALRLSEDRSQKEGQERLFTAQNQQMHAFASEARQKLSGRRVVDDNGEFDDLPLTQWSRVSRQTQPTETACDEISHDHYQEEENDLEKFRRDEREGEDIEEDKYDRVKDHDGGLGFDRLRTVKFDLQKNQDEEILEKKYSKRTSRKTCRPKSAPVFDLHFGATKTAERTRQGQQLLSYRRLCSDVERQVARDNAQRKRQRKIIEKIKREKEDWRMQEEEQARRIVEPRDPITGDTRFETSLRDQLERTHLQEVLQEREEKRNKQLEMTRYLDALRKNLQEKLTKKGLELPALCCCGETLWDTNPDTCANNCFFYHNHRAYARALQSLLVSAEIV